MKLHPYQIYQSMMLDIKIRIRAIDLKISQENVSNLEIEFCFLQSRKIIEQVCFSSILCDKSRYEDFRKLEGLTNEKDHGNYINDWNARTILIKLKDISPHFMPRPIGTVTSENGKHTITDGLQTTHAELITMWEKCGSFLHIPKPFGESYDSHIKKQIKRYRESIKTLKEYSKYFKDLLWHHAAIGIEYSSNKGPLSSLEPGKPLNAWLVNFGDNESDDIKIELAIAQ